MFFRLVAIKQTKSKRSDICCRFPKLDFLCLWTNYVLVNCTGFTGPSDLSQREQYYVKVLTNKMNWAIHNCSKSPKRGGGGSPRKKQLPWYPQSGWKAMHIKERRHNKKKKKERIKQVLTMASYAWNRHHWWRMQAAWTNLSRTHISLETYVLDPDRNRYKAL